MQTKRSSALVGALLVVVAVTTLGAVAGAQAGHAGEPVTTTVPTTPQATSPMPSATSPGRAPGEADAPVLPTAAEPDVEASAGPIDGWVADGDSGVPLGGICVALYSVADDAFAGWMMTSGDGSWTFTPAVPGAYRIAYYRPAVQGDCTSMPLAAGPVPEWAFDQSLSPAEPKTAVPPPAAASILDGTSGVSACLGDTRLHAGGCDRRPNGKGVISGTVTQPGPMPVASACIYVLAEIGGETHGTGAMTDADGRFVVEGLVDGVEYVVAAVPPFETNGVPCDTEDGPPPPSGDGLQPEFYADTWIDLTSPELDDDVVGYAAAHGAQLVRAGATGVDVCLTDDAGDVTPRGVCTDAEAVADPAPAATEAQPASSVTGTLPLTGRDPAVPAAVGAALVALGAAGVAAARRRRQPGA